MTQSRVLIIGYGNPLRSDDGLGWHAAEALADHFRGRPEIHVLACQQLTPDLADDLSAVDLAVFIDASRDLKPGFLKVEPINDGAQLSGAAASPYSHHVQPAALLHLCQDLWGRAPQGFLLSVGVSDCAAGEALSRELDRAVDSVVHKVATLV